MEKYESNLQRVHVQHHVLYCYMTVPVTNTYPRPIQSEKARVARGLVRFRT
jgi:hypothetical protein